MIDFIVENTKNVEISGHVIKGDLLGLSLFINQSTHLVKIGGQEYPFSKISVHEICKGIEYVQRKIKIEQDEAKLKELEKMLGERYVRIHGYVYEKGKQK